MRLYNRVEPKDGEYVQYVGTYVLEWRHEWGVPTVAFVESDLNFSEVYVVACRPYPEKVSGLKWYATREDAVRYLDGLPDDIRPSFAVYGALIAIDKVFDVGKAEGGW